MINGKFEAKKKADSFLRLITKGLVKLRFTPNAVTVSGLLLVIASSLYYVHYKNSLVYALLLIVSFGFDALDGAVARSTGKTSRFGAYMDAVFDRYQEGILYFVIAYVHNVWPLAFIAFAGAMLISYNKARAAMEINIKNDNWPDLLERTERVTLIIIILIINSIFIKYNVIFYSMIVMAVLNNFTAIQRFFRVRKRIKESTDIKSN